MLRTSATIEIHTPTAVAAVAPVSTTPGGTARMVPTPAATRPTPAISVPTGDRFFARWGCRTGSVVATPQRKQMSALSAISVPHERHFIGKKNTEARSQKPEAAALPRRGRSGARPDVSRDEGQVDQQLFEQAVVFERLHHQAPLLELVDFGQQRVAPLHQAQQRRI